MRSIAAILLLLTPRAGFTWGAEGHRLVVRIAATLLTASTRAGVAATLAPGESLPALASWADDVRNDRKETQPWHYVDIPLHSSGLDMQRDCPAGDCVIGKIEQFRKLWRDPTITPGARREALLFLIHFVGDLHQPLHCEDHGDQGGNQVKVQFLGEDTQLHSVWDAGILQHMPAEEELLPRLLQAVTPQHIAEWSRGTAGQWAGESFRLAQQVAYGLLPPAGRDGVIRLGASYEQAAVPVVEMQLEKAGVRLAAILNQSAR
jgi:hypothetical protein